MCTPSDKSCVVPTGWCKYFEVGMTYVYTEFKWKLSTGPYST